MVRGRSFTLDGFLTGALLSFILITLAACILYTGHALLAVALRENPTVTVVLLATLGVALILTARLSGSRPRPADEAPSDEDSGDDGGLRRPAPETPEDPPPGGDLRPDWDEFDAARREWERVPALVG